MTIRDLDGKVVFRGTVDVQPTLDRIAAGKRLNYRNDGSTFQNREGRLPRKRRVLQGVRASDAVAFRTGSAADRRRRKRRSVLHAGPLPHVQANSMSEPSGFLFVDDIAAYRDPEARWRASLRVCGANASCCSSARQLGSPVLRPQLGCVRRMPARFLLVARGKASYDLARSVAVAFRGSASHVSGSAEARSLPGGPVKATSCSRSFLRRPAARLRARRPSDQPPGFSAPEGLLRPTI